MQNIDVMQTHLIPILYIFYALILLVKRPGMDSNIGFAIKRAKKSQAAWTFTQNVAAVYCVAAAAILLGCLYLISPPDLVQIGLEIVLVAVMYPIINAIVKKKFPD